MIQDKLGSRCFAMPPLQRMTAYPARSQTSLSHSGESYGLRKRSCHLVMPSSMLFVALLTAGLMSGAIAQTARATPASQTEPFKVAKIHIETNGSACDMGPQIAFDTDGITSGSVSDPKGRKIYSFQAKAGMKATGGQTEGFLETVEPQITELLNALGCEPSDEEGVAALDDIFEAWPA